MQRKQLSPEQFYILYDHVSKNKEKLQNLTKVDAAKEIRRELHFPVGVNSCKRAMAYFNLKKDPCAQSNTCKISILTKHLAILYKESLLPIPEELRKLLE